MTDTHDEAEYDGDLAVLRAFARGEPTGAVGVTHAEHALAAVDCVETALRARDAELAAVRVAMDSMRKTVAAGDDERLLDAVKRVVGTADRLADIAAQHGVSTDPDDPDKPALSLGVFVVHGVTLGGSKVRASVVLREGDAAFTLLLDNMTAVDVAQVLGGKVELLAVGVDDDKPARGR